MIDAWAGMLVDVPVAKEGAGAGVVVGCPFPQGRLMDASQLALHGPGGEVACAMQPLTRWREDGSIQWLKLVWSAHQPGSYQLKPKSSANESVTWDDPVKVMTTASGIELGNRRLKVAFHAKGSGPIQSISHDGHLIFDEESIEFQVNHATSRLGRVKKLEVLEASPARSRVRVQGDHADKQGHICLTYQLDVELWTGSSTLRLDYQYFHVQPGLPSVTVDQMRAVFRPRLAGEVGPHFLQRHHGLSMKPRPVFARQRVEIRADHSRNLPYIATREMLEDDGVYPAYLVKALPQTSPWIGLASSQGQTPSVHLQLVDMVNHRPKKLVADEGELHAELWPTEAGAMQLPQGRSRRHTLTLTFTGEGEATPTPAVVQQSLNQPLHEGRATLAPGVARQAGVFDQDRVLSPGSHLRMEQYLAKLMHAVTIAGGEFDHGDNTESGYFRNYVAAGRQPRREGMVEEISPMNSLCHDAITPGDPAWYEPVWANNEYDLIHALCSEVMRTGQRRHWQTLHAMVRHNLEVDFIAYSDDPWQHHGSPAHSAYHAFASAYPSHLWTQGLLEFHCMTGDEAARDIAIQLGDTILRNLQDPQRRKDLWGFNREVGWALLALVQLHESTALHRFKTAADEIIAFLMSYDRGRSASTIKLSNVDPMDDLHSQVVSSFFGYASMVEAMDRYARLEKRDDIHRWLADFLERVRQAAEHHLQSGRAIEPVRHMLLHGLAIGYGITGEAAFLRTGMLGLEMFIDTPLWTQCNGQVKTTAMIHRGLSWFVHHAHQQKLLDAIEYRFAHRS